MSYNNEKILVAYFSHKGENYTKDGIADLKIGNTEVIAKKIAEKTNADLFEIIAIKEYPYEYNSCTDVAKQEVRANSRPELIKDLDISEYDIIFLGYPNWWGTMPMPVCTFLEKHDFTGKTVLPFCTHEGSGMGNSEEDLKKILHIDTVKHGLPIRGSSVNNADNLVDKWLSSK